MKPWTWVSAVLVCMGCRSTESETSYVLLDEEARAAGVVLEGGAGPVSLLLPMKVAADSVIAIDSETGRAVLRVGERELIYVRGPEAQVDRRPLSRAVDLDRLSVLGTEEAARELSDAVGADVQPSDEGWFVLTAPGVFEAASGVFAPAGLRESRPEHPFSGDDADGGVVASVFDRGVRAVDPSAVRRLPALPVVHSPLLSVPRAVATSGLGCSDPLDGTWISRQFYPEFGGDYEFTLEVTRSGAELRGEILSHFVRTQACGCRPFAPEDWTVRMPAQGRAEGTRFEFGGVRWSLAERIVGREPRDYNLDRFAGSPVGDGDTLETVNNDGGDIHEYPTVFRRVACGAP